MVHHISPRHLGPHRRRRRQRYRTDSEESPRGRSGSSRVALLRSLEPRRSGFLPWIYPELVMSGAWLQRRCNSRKERTENLPCRRSNPARGTIATRPERRTSATTSPKPKKTRHRPTHQIFTKEEKNSMLRQNSNQPEQTLAHDLRLVRSSLRPVPKKLSK